MGRPPEKEINRQVAKSAKLKTRRGGEDAK
jgi:hypothetical protein